jgi:hypothetical protein
MSAVVSRMFSRKFSSIRLLNASLFDLLLYSFNDCSRVIMCVLMEQIIDVESDAISRLGFIST